MIFFKVSPDDQSIFYLGQIFGYVGSVLPVKNAPLILGTMFKTFNTIALTLGAVVLIYTTVVGLLMTAHEGEFLGKGKWNGLWTPLRLLFGIIALFPTPTGYSILQIIFMWIIIQGVAAADTLWNTTLNFISVAGSVQATIPIQTLETRGTMTNLFQDLTCQASARAVYPDWYNQGKSIKYYYHCGDPANANSQFCGMKAEMLDPLRGPQTVPATPTTQGTYDIGPKGQCGRLSYDSCGAANATPADESMKSKIKQVACQAQQEALKVIVPTLGGIAQTIVDADHDYLTFFTTVEEGYKPADFISKYCEDNKIKQCCIHMPAESPLNPIQSCPEAASFPNVWDKNGDNIDLKNASSEAFNQVYLPYVVKPTYGAANFINSAADYYVQAIVSKVVTFIASQPPDVLSNAWMKDAQAKGWITAGSFYYVLAASNSNNLDAANPAFTVSGWLRNSGMAGYRNNYVGVTYLMGTLQNQSQKSSAFAGDSMPELKPLANVMSGASADLLSDFMNLVTGETTGKVVQNPLIKLQGFGHLVIKIATIVFFSFLALIGLGVLFGSLSAFVGLGTGMVAAPIANFFNITGIILLPLILGFIGSLFVFGATLAIYTPLVPYIIFTLGGIGWIIATIEAMVAAPLVALGIITPGGHDILGHAQPGLMIILNVLLRPTLMIFGLIASILVGAVAVTLVNNTFLGVMVQISGYGLLAKGDQGYDAAVVAALLKPSLVELILFIAAYVFLIVTVLNKSFSLIYAIPERIFSYIGGTPISYGEAEQESKVSGGFEKTAAATGAGAAFIASTGQKAQEKMKEKSDAKRKAEGGDVTLGKPKGP